MTGGRALAAAAVGLSLALSACGSGGDESGPTPLAANLDPKDQQEFGKNAARVGGFSSADVAAAAVTAAYPPGGAQPSSWFLVRKENWRSAALAAQFSTRLIGAAVLPIEKEFLPTPTVDTLSRIKVRGYPKTKGLNTIVLGKATTDVFIDLNDRKLKMTQLKESPYKLSEKMVALHGGAAGRFTDNIVVASGEQREYALPAAAWTAYSGDTLVFAGNDSLPEETLRVVAQREKLRLEKPTIYLIGPEKVISEDVAAALAPYGEVRRVAGRSAVETAIALARRYDKDTLFGWYAGEAPASFTIVNQNHGGNAIGAWQFAAVGPQAPLLLTDSSRRLPRPLVRYLDSVRGSEKSYGFVFGDRKSISSAAFTQFDGLLGEE